MRCLILVFFGPKIVVQGYIDYRRYWNLTRVLEGLKNKRVGSGGAKGSHTQRERVISVFTFCSDNTWHVLECRQTFIRYCFTKIGEQISDTLAHTIVVTIANLSSMSLNINECCTEHLKCLLHSYRTVKPTVYIIIHVWKYFYLFRWGLITVNKYIGHSLRCK